MVESKEMATIEKKTSALSTENISEQTLKDFLFGSETKLNEEQMALFLGTCKENNLNPFKKEVYPIAFYNKETQKYELSIITGYEVYLKRAAATGLLGGWNVAFSGTMEENNLKATITIHRKDFDHPFTWDVYWFEYNKSNSMWKNKPYTMLRKVAIGQGMKLCFPNELAGLPYMLEEEPEAMIHMGIATIVEQEPEGALGAIQKEQEKTEEPDKEEPKSEPAKAEEPKKEEKQEKQEKQEKNDPDKKIDNSPANIVHTGYVEKVIELPVMAIIRKDSVKLKFQDADNYMLPLDHPLLKTLEEAQAWLSKSSEFLKLKD